LADHRSPLPDGLVPYDLSVEADGSVWLLGEYDERGVPIVRYAAGQWQTTTVPSVHGHELATAPDGSVCVASQEKLLCFRNERAPAVAADLPIGGFVVVAPDGAIWVAGSQLVRLPTRLDDG
jgi:streptogramin lyase